MQLFIYIIILVSNDFTALNVLVQLAFNQFIFDVQVRDPCIRPEQKYCNISLTVDVIIIVFNDFTIINKYIIYYRNYENY